MFDSAGHWQPTTSECSLEKDQPFDERECLGDLFSNSNVYFLGNSVTRDLMFTMAALLNNSNVLRRDIQTKSCIKSRNVNDIGATCQFDSKLYNASLIFGWTHWFSRNATLKPGDFCGDDQDKCMTKFFQNATTKDALWIMMGHEYHHYHWSPPSVQDRTLFLASVRKAFPGSIVFAVPTPVFFNLENDLDHRYGGYVGLNASRKVSLEVFSQQGVPVIETYNYCYNKSLYADDIHHSGPEQPDGTALPGQLVLAHIKLFTSIVNEKRQCVATAEGAGAAPPQAANAFGASEGVMIRLKKQI
jgi:hypothetical protein